MPVVVEVSHGGSHAVKRRVQSGSSGHILEMPAIQVAVKNAGGRSRPVTGQWGSVDQIEIRSSVTVVVEESRSGSHGFGQIFARRSVVEVREPDPGVFRDVGEGVPWSLSGCGFLTCGGRFRFGSRGSGLGGTAFIARPPGAAAASTEAQSENQQPESHPSPLFSRPCFRRK